MPSRVTRALGRQPRKHVRSHGFVSSLLTLNLLEFRRQITVTPVKRCNVVVRTSPVDAVCIVMQVFDEILVRKSSRTEESAISIVNGQLRIAQIREQQ